MTPAATPVIDVVIVTYGSCDLVRRCLSSLVAIGADLRLQVTVVDNSSPDSTPEMIESEFPTVTLIRREDNPGFAVANNVALLQTTAPLILVLNPDTEISRETLEHLAAVLESEPDIGVIGCRLELADGTFDHASKRFIPSPTEALTYFWLKLRGQKGGRYVAAELGERGRGDVDAVNGALMLIRQEAINVVGLLDESYWMYGEDLDWCARFKEAGWRVFYDGSVSALHIKGGSSNNRRSLKLNFHFHKSMAIFYRNRQASGNNILLNGLVYTGIWARFSLIQVQNVFHGAKIKLRPAGR